MLLTITHELFHYRHKKSRWVKEDDFRTEESIAGYLENAAALYFLKKGEILTSPANYAKTFLTGHFDGGAGFDPAPRENHEVFARDFNANTTIPNEAYTYADLMEYLTIKRKLPENLKAGDLLDKYSYLSSHKTNYMKWFDTTDEKVFNGYVQSFCEDTLSRIYFRQDANEVRSSTPDLALEELQVSRKDPVKEMKTKKGHLIMRCFNLSSQDAKTEGPFNAFIVRGNACTPEEVSFYTSSDMFKKEKNKMEYFSGDKAAYQGAYFKPNSSALPFTVVALFAPDKPEIKKVKKDYVRFVLPKADKSLVKNGYITGALVTFRNAEGQEKYIRAGIEKLGKDVKWSIPGVGLGGFTLRVKWIRENQDGSVYESPASAPVGKGVVPDVKKEEPKASANVGKEKKQKEEPAKKEEKKRKQQDAEEKMVVYEEIKEIPWKAVSVTIELPLEGALWMGLDDCYVPKRCVWPPLAEEFPMNGYQLLNPKCEAKFEKAGEGYRLTCKQTLSGTKRKDFLEDGEYHLAVTIFFDEDLHPVKGSFDGTSNQTKILPSWNKKPDGTIINIRDRRVPSTMTYSGTFSFRDGINGRLETLNMKGHWQKLRANRGAEREDVDYSKTMADLEENRGQIRLGLIKK